MKYPNIEEKMKQMIHEREEALATHELARTRMSNQKQSRFVPFEKGQKVWLDTRKSCQNVKDHLKSMRYWDPLLID